MYKGAKLPNKDDLFSLGSWSEKFKFKKPSVDFAPWNPLTSCQL